MIVDVDRIALVEYSKAGKNVQMLCIYTKQNTVPVTTTEQWRRTIEIMKYGNKGGETGNVSDSGNLLYCYRVKLGWACWSKEGRYII